MKQMEETGSGILKVNVEMPKAIYRCEGKYQALVAQTSLLKAEGKQMRTKGFLLAESVDKGKTWTFLDLAEVSTEEALRKMLPVYEEFDMPRKMPPVLVE